MFEWRSKTSSRCSLLFSVLSSSRGQKFIYFFVAQLPFGLQVEQRVGVQRQALTMRLPAYTNESSKAGVAYFPCVSQNEDTNMLLTAFMYHLDLHVKQFGGFPSAIYLALDSKGTGKNYKFVSGLAELVQIRKELGIELVMILYGEPGHHVMKIEHMHSRLTTWFKRQKLIDSCSSFQAALDNKTENCTHFAVKPMSWIFDFKRRYEQCVSTVTKQLVGIKERRLCVITREAVTFYTEPTKELMYAANLGLDDQQRRNDKVEIKDWFSGHAPREHANPWALPDKFETKRLQSLYEVTSDCPGTQQTIAALKKYNGRLGDKPELTPFWCAPTPIVPPVATVQPTQQRAIVLQVRPAEVPVTRSAPPALMAAPLEHPFPCLRAAKEPPRRYLVQVVFDSQIFTCSVVEADELNRCVTLKTLNKGWEKEDLWETELEPEYENNMASPDGWRYISVAEASVAMEAAPIPFS